MKRRHFLQHTLLAAGLPLVGLNRRVLAGEPNTSTQRRVVLVELAGANDGLNTLVPFTNDDYHSLRPTLGLSASDVQALDDSMGMHKALAPLMPLWERGELAWVQGLGYPKPNRSHFKSIALWETAGDGLRSRDTRGWMTHAVEHQLARTINDPHGISLAGSLSVFASESGRWLSARSVKELLQPSPQDGSEAANNRPMLALLQRQLAGLDTTMTTLAAKLEPALQAQALPVFDGGPFGEQLRQVATMIAAGLDTPVYRVQLGGFDTHNDQKGRHARLLKILGQGLASFANALNSMGEWQNTLIMSYSEFGRRAAENRSAGTDHGTAAPHMLMGGAIHGGLYGLAPDLAELSDGDPDFTMDYRALYHSILVHGLGASGEQQTLETYADTRLQELITRL